MTAFSTDPETEATPVAPEAGPGAPARFILTVCGSALMFSSFALWLVPGSGGLPELTLIKLGLSVFMLITGLFCMATTRPRGS